MPVLSQTEAEAVEVEEGESTQKVEQRSSAVALAADWRSFSSAVVGSSSMLRMDFSQRSLSDLPVVEELVSSCRPRLQRHIPCAVCLRHICCVVRGRLGSRGRLEWLGTWAHIQPLCLDCGLGDIDGLGESQYFLIQISRVIRT